MRTAAQYQLEAFQERGKMRYGDKFDMSEILAAPQFLPFFQRPVRIRVSSYGGEYVRTGTVSATTGWRPALLLIHRSSDLGSGDVLGADDKIIAVKYTGDRSYRSLEREEGPEATS